MTPVTYNDMIQFIRTVLYLTAQFLGREPIIWFVGLFLLCAVGALIKKYIL